MKTTKILISGLATLIMAIGFNACEKDLNYSDAEISIEEKSAELTDSSVIIDDNALANKMLDIQTEPANAINDMVRYEYNTRNLLVKMHYIKNPAIITPTNAQASRIIKTDEFFYDKNRITGLTRVFHVPTVTANVAPPTINKRYMYDRSGRLTDIISKITNGQSARIRHEILRYNNAGQMVKKVVRGEEISYLYEYDRSGKLVKVSEYFKRQLRKITMFGYSANGNVIWKKIFRPVTTDAANDRFSRGIIKYEYDSNRNPFLMIKLPYGSLFESMDELSNNNYTTIATPWREIRYKYQYSLITGFPVARYTGK